jgi:MSHA pilin protein MshD
MCIRDAAGASRQLVRAHAQAGISLIELIMFIVIVSVGVAGILSVLNVTTQKSTDPQIRKQMLAVAEALLEEVQSKPFTYCDPNDPQAATAQSAAVGPNDCKIKVEALGPELAFSDPGPIVYQASNETRTSTDSPFDNVNDYNGLSLAPASDINGNSIIGYSAAVSVTQEQLEASVPLAASLRITVTVTHGGASLSLSGYRLRYAPKSLP